MILTSKIRLYGIVLLLALYSSCNNTSKNENSISLSESFSIQSEADSNQQKIKDYISSFVENRDFDGFALVKSKDETIISESFSLLDELNSKSQFMVGSITKTFTAEAVNGLFDQNKLREDSNISDIIPGTPNHADITIKQLLMHSSGIPDYYNIMEFRMLRNKEMQPEDFYRWISKFPLDFEPGFSNSYSNSGYNVLAMAIQATTNANYHEYLNNHIFSPLKMTSTGSLSSSETINLVTGYQPGNSPDFIREPSALDSSWLIGSGSVYSSAEDLLKWGEEVKKRLRSGGNWKPYGWGIRQRDSQIYLEQNGRIPGYSASIQIYPETDCIIILLSRIESDAPGEIANGIADIIHNVQMHIPQKRIIQEIDIDELSKYTGIYEITPTFHVTVSIDDNGLGIATGRGSNLSYSVLDPLGDDNFFFRVGNTQVGFKGDNKGTIIGMFWGESGPYPKVK